ncbi:OmpA family protein [Shewanella marina]|uniref:OmpA family protein n=1 Tax=Shewanella marina TaxID=487319 RepID=UPI00047189AE|nr:OmpA family protein [Shewanella marina]
MKKLLIISLLPIVLSGCVSYSESGPVKQQFNLQDDDSDGVINARDLCPDTGSVAVVNNDGCPLQLTTQAKGELHILFANDSTYINPSYNKQIETMVMLMQKHPQLTLIINGYASKIGQSAYNQNLSLRRAKQVEQLFEVHNIAASRLKIVGFGDTKPILAQDVDESYKLSRRVTAKLVTNEHIQIDKWNVFSK